MLVTMSDKELNRVNKSLTFRYDKMIYLVDPTEENSRIAGENIIVYDYPPVSE